MGRKATGTPAYSRLVGWVPGRKKDYPRRELPPGILYFQIRARLTARGEFTGWGEDG